MIKKRFITGLLAAALAIGFLLTGCEDATSPAPAVNATLSLGDGTANDASVTLTLSAGEWKTSSDSYAGVEGVFAYNPADTGVTATGALDGTKKALTVTFRKVSAAYNGAVKIEDAEPALTAILTGLKGETTGITGTLTLGTNTPVPIVSNVDSRVEIESAAGANVAASAVTADVTFTGASSLEDLGLAAADFEADLGGEVTNVSASGAVATVTVTFPANTAPSTTVSIVVGVNPGSSKIRGDAEATITQQAPGVLFATGVLTGLDEIKQNGLFTGSTVTLTGAALSATTSALTIYKSNSTDSGVTVSVAAGAGPYAVTFSETTLTAAAGYYFTIPEANLAASGGIITGGVKVTFAVAAATHGILDVDVGEGTIELSVDEATGVVSIDGAGYTDITWKLNGGDVTAWTTDGKTKYTLPIYEAGVYYIEVQATDAGGVQTGRITVTIAAE
jgi:hypothetical protein